MYSSCHDGLVSGVQIEMQSGSHPRYLCRQRVEGDNLAHLANL